tara:strand:+ start:3727 stop:4482 length:756 start_codon:yes stop_codon:yes gene_type:complete
MKSILNMSQPEQASAEGLEFIQPKLNEMQAAILAFLKFRAFHGATDSEIAHQLEIGDNARKRRGELCKEGHVTALSRKRRSCDSLGRATGPTNQTVWVAKEYAPTHTHATQNIKAIEDSISSLVLEARRLKRILRKPDMSPDDLYSRHTRVSDAYSAYTTKLHVAWEAIRFKKAADDGAMVSVGDMVNTSRGPAKVTQIDLTQRYEKYGNDVAQASWADARAGYVVVVTDNGHWQYGQSISPITDEKGGME